MYSKTNLQANKHVFVNAELDQHKKTIISLIWHLCLFPTSIIYPNLDFSHHSYFKIHFLISEISDFIKNFLIWVVPERSYVQLNKVANTDATKSLQICYDLAAMTNTMSFTWQFLSLIHGLNLKTYNTKLHSSAKSS